MRRAAFAALIVILAIVLSAGVLLAHLWIEEPLAALPRAEPGALRVVEERREAWRGRTLVHVALRGPAVGDVRFVVSLPEPLPATRIPLVVVLGGLRGGSRSIRQISEVAGDVGPNAFIGYDWPLPRDPPKGIELVRRTAELRRAVLSVPGQVDAILTWAAGEPWMDPGRVSLLGFSLGAFVAPAAQRLAQERGASVGWTILAYGGAPIGAVIAGHPAIEPAWLGPPLGAAADLLLRPVQPGEHLPHLRGRFLVLGAASDRLIAARAAERLRELTPEPRRSVVIEGDHMGVGPGRAKLLATVIAVTRAWLVEEGAIA